MNETLMKFSNGALAKANLSKNNPIKYLLLSIMAGVYVGFGIILIFSIGAPLAKANDPALKALMGASFAVALSLVVFTSSELFTGNTMVMTLGIFGKKITSRDLIRVWIYSYIGNLIGSILLAYTMKLTGLINNEILSTFLQSSYVAKTSPDALALVTRGILCNMLVCLAVFMTNRTENDAAKLILIFWCLFAFIGSGFEHSVANMTLLPMAYFTPGNELEFMGMIKNLSYVTIGNIIGGAVCLGTVYGFIGRENK